jgi:hypothetical protein
MKRRFWPIDGQPTFGLLGDGRLGLYSRSMALRPVSPAGDR